MTEEQASQIVIVGGWTCPEHAQNAAEAIGTTASDPQNKQFSNGELHAEYQDSIRSKKVFIVQTDSELPTDHTPNGRPWSVNDSIMQTALMVDAAARGGAKDITVIKPHFAYARQDRKKVGREPISAAAHVNLLKAVGTDHIVTIDIHAQQIQMLMTHFDTLSATGRLKTAIGEYINYEDQQIEDVVFVAPDGGSLSLPDWYQKKLGGQPSIVMPKTRSSSDPSQIMHAVERVEGVGGRTCVLVDDMIDTGGTIISAVKKLKKSGAEKVLLVATHGLFSGSAINRLEDAGDDIDQIIVSNTVPQVALEGRLGPDKTRVIDVASLIGKSIFEIATDGSVSSIFEDNMPYRR